MIVTGFILIKVDLTLFDVFTEQTTD